MEASFGGDNDDDWDDVTCLGAEKWRLPGGFAVSCAAGPTEMAGTGNLPTCLDRIPVYARARGQPRASGRGADGCTFAVDRGGDTGPTRGRDNAVSCISGCCLVYRILLWLSGAPPSSPWDAGETHRYTTASQATGTRLVPYLQPVVNRLSTPTIRTEKQRAGA